MLILHLIFQDFHFALPEWVSIHPIGRLLPVLDRPVSRRIFSSRPMHCVCVQDMPIHRLQQFLPIRSLVETEGGRLRQSMGGFVASWLQSQGAVWPIAENG